MNWIKTPSLFLVIVGGIKSIAEVKEKIVPFVEVFYCLFVAIVIVLNCASLPATIGNILIGALSLEGIACTTHFLTVTVTYPTKARSTT